MKKTISLILVLVMLLPFAVQSFAAGSFSDTAYTSVVTASDFQTTEWYQAYNRFGGILERAKSDGLDAPGGVIIGGDYTVVLADDAVPGIFRIRDEVLDTWPDYNPATMVAIQGNHDNPNRYFTETGFRDMGYYCVFSINEDDFPWKQNSKKNAEKTVCATAFKLESALNTMIDNKDFRPVFIVTHVPLHHSYRADGGDNKYAEILFDVINKAAGKLDIVFLFGHNHSSPYDDYIGGAVNFMAPGETIRLCDRNNVSEDAYIEKTLNFTYTNCGYVGYSGNADDEVSTSTLTVDFIQLEKKAFRFVRYSEDGVYSVEKVSMKHSASKKDIANRAELVPVLSPEDCGGYVHSDDFFISTVFKMFTLFAKMLKIFKYCVCGEQIW